MSFENLGLNLSAMSSVNTKQAVLQSALDTKITEDSKIRENDIVPSYPFKLFPSDKLLTWTPQTVVENISFDEQSSVSAKADNTGENLDTTSFDSLFDCDEIINAIKGLRSSASSVSLDTLSCYSYGSEEQINSGESESSFNSVSEDDYTENSIIFKNVKISSVSVTPPDITDILPSEGKEIPEPNSLEHRSWKDKNNYLATDEEWDEDMSELGDEFEKELGFDSASLSFDETINRISSAFDCEDEEVEAGEFEDVILSPRCFEGEEADQSFDSLFDGEDSMMKEIENYNESQETAKDSSDFKFTEQERQEYLELSLRRYARAIRNNPHLSHLFH